MSENTSTAPQTKTETQTAPQPATVQEPESVQLARWLATNVMGWSKSIEGDGAYFDKANHCSRLVAGTPIYNTRKKLNLDLPPKFVFDPTGTTHDAMEALSQCSQFIQTMLLERGEAGWALAIQVVGRDKPMDFTAPTMPMVVALACRAICPK